MTEILDEGAVSEIETQAERCLSFLTFGEPTRGNRYVESIDADFYFEENTDAEFDAFVLLRHIPALCATVKHLRAKHEQLALASGEWATLLDRIRAWSKCKDGYPLDEHVNNITVQRERLQSEVEQLRVENERLTESLTKTNALGEEMLTRMEKVAGIGTKADHGWYYVMERVEATLAQAEQERDALREEAEQSERYQARMLNSKRGPR